MLKALIKPATFVNDLSIYTDAVKFGFTPIHCYTDAFTKYINCLHLK